MSGVILLCVYTFFSALTIYADATGEDNLKCSFEILESFLYSSLLSIVHNQTEAQFHYDFFFQGSSSFTQLSHLLFSLHFTFFHLPIFISLPKKCKPVSLNEVSTCFVKVFLCVCVSARIFLLVIL